MFTWNSSSVPSSLVSDTSGHRLFSFQGLKNFRKGVEVETVRMAEKRWWDHCYLWLRVSCSSPFSDVVGKGVCWVQLFDGKGAAYPGTFPRLTHDTNQHESSYTLLVRKEEAHCKYMTSKTNKQQKKKIHQWNSGQQAGLVGGQLCEQRFHWGQVASDRLLLVVEPWHEKWSQVSRKVGKNGNIQLKTARGKCL